MDANGPIDILTKGREWVSPAYQYCYDQANIKPFPMPTMPNTNLVFGSSTVMGKQMPYIIWYIQPNDTIIKEAAKLVNLSDAAYNCSTSNNNVNVANRLMGFGGGYNSMIFAGTCTIKFQYNEGI